MGRERMKVEQHVMAYEAEQDRLRALLPGGFVSLRPVLRINAEIRDDFTGYVELNTPVEHEGCRGWLNVGHWQDVPFARQGKTVIFRTDFLEISFTGVGIGGGCPAEKDNDGCFFLEDALRLRKTGCISSHKEFCDCAFRWQFTGADAHGVSLGKTLPAYPTPCRTVYPRTELTPANAAKIPCGQVLGAYMVVFDR